MTRRKTVVVSIRVDKRILDKLARLAEDHRSRNFLIEQILGRECGLPYYQWRKDDELVD